MAYICRRISKLYGSNFGLQSRIIAVLEINHTKPPHEFYKIFYRLIDCISVFFRNFAKNYQMMKRIGLFILLSIYSVSNALGYDIEVDQLQYLLNVETSTVSYCGISSEYKRSYINIPVLLNTTEGIFPLYPLKPMHSEAVTKHQQKSQYPIVSLKLNQRLFPIIVLW